MRRDHVLADPHRRAHARDARPRARRRVAAQPALAHRGQHARRSTSNRSRSSAQASSTCPPEPWSSGITAPSGTVSRRPSGRSCVATHTRWSPSRTYSCALSPVSALSRCEHRAGRLDQRERRAGRRAPARRAGAPSRNRPSPSRTTSAVALERDREPVRGRAGQPGLAHEIGERARARAARSRRGCRPRGRGSARRLGRPRATLSTSLILASHMSETGARAWPMAQTLSEKVWDRHVVHSARGRARPALHRPAPRARGHLAAGVRRPAPRRPRRAPARPHGRDDGPQRADRRPRPAARGPDLGEADRTCSRGTARSSASAATRWAIPARASCTSSGPSRASRSRA